MRHRFWSGLTSFRLSAARLAPTPGPCKASPGRTGREETVARPKRLLAARMFVRQPKSAGEDLLDMTAHFSLAASVRSGRLSPLGPDGGATQITQHTLAQESTCIESRCLCKMLRVNRCGGAVSGRQRSLQALPTLLRGCRAQLDRGCDMAKPINALAALGILSGTFTPIALGDAPVGRTGDHCSPAGVALRIPLQPSATWIRLGSPRSPGRPQRPASRESELVGQPEKHKPLRGGILLMSGVGPAF
jgi:hypothetical protein